MTTLEIINNFLKGSYIASISEKQRLWIIGQAKKEGLLNTYGSDEKVYFNDCFYTIKQCRRHASGGSYVGSRAIQGRYNLEKMYHIRFTENSKHTAVYGQADLDRFNRDGIGFELITPVK